MILPKGGVTWKSAQANLPPTRAIWKFITQTKVLLSLASAAIIFLLWRGISGTADEMQKFMCYGPNKSPLEMNANEQADWNGGQQTPVTFNHHKPIEVNSSTIQHIDLNGIKSTPKALINNERVLILTPLKDASPYLEKYFDLLAALTYPHNLIDLAFLISDSTDDTFAVLSMELERLQRKPEKAFHSTTIVTKDFGSKVGSSVEDRHGAKVQAERRKLMGKARNFLLSAALKPEHSWVYWRDVDIVENPPEIIEDLVEHNRDIIVPNIWFHRYNKDGSHIEGRFDYNSWQETEQGRRLAAKVGPDVVIAEGYREFETGRIHMCKMGRLDADKDEEIPLDGIGGVSVMVKADVHRAGINFPSYSFERQAETEGFAKMAKRAGYGVFGLPNYVVWHQDTEEKPGNA